MNNALYPKKCMSFLLDCSTHNFWKKYPKTCQLFICIFSEKKICENCCLIKIALVSIRIEIFKEYFGFLFLTFMNTNLKRRNNKNVNFPHLVPFCHSLSQIIFESLSGINIKIVTIFNFNHVLITRNHISN